LIIAGELQESSKKAVLRIVRGSLRSAVESFPEEMKLVLILVQVAQSDAIEEGESVQNNLKDAGFT